MGHLAIVALGFFVGIMIGLTGVGGGVLMTPILILAFGIQPSIAVGTDLFYSALTKATGAIKHWRQGSVDFRLAALLSAGSLPTALLGIAVAKVAKDRLGQEVEPIIATVLAWVCLVVAAAIVLRVIADGTDTANGQNAKPAWSINRVQYWVLLLGMTTGVLVALTSIGAGSIVMIFLMLLCRLPTGRLVGTDLFHAAILAGVCAFGHLWAGNIDFSLAALLLLGSIPGVIVGSHLTIRVPDVVVRVSVALVLALSGTRLIIR